jgi:hypothetical protein
MYLISFYHGPDPTDLGDLGHSSGMAAYSDEHAQVLLAKFREIPPVTINDTITWSRDSDEAVMEQWKADWGPTGMLWRKVDTERPKDDDGFMVN